ncbi:unnamed protein product [Dibothriocephalus latus]|uniref:Uncharacterized protein n=1 Tax=Dibothriocephalus latus TaxID=60516 RepID=A0A3P7M216_DIBLA|nr:unnamed protein product [Dibothriocephalus latus]
MQSVVKVWGSELDDRLLYCPGSSNQGTPVSQSEIFIGSAGSASIAPRFTFNSTGSAACMWSSHRLRCYLGGFTVDFSTFFDCGGRAAGKGKTQGLAILLTSKTVSRSLLCFLPDLRKPSCGRTISLHGKAVMLGLVCPDSNQSSVTLSGSSLGAFSETVFAGVLSIAFEHGLVAVIVVLAWRFLRLL